MTDSAHTRRAFLSSLGALSATGLIPRDWASADFPTVTRGAGVRRGLSLAADDFAFAPGLIYLQTGSLGPTPRPVMERAIAAWKELELNPARYGYEEQERAMDDVRAKAAAFIGCKTEELVLTNCTTEGMNWTA